MVVRARKGKLPVWQLLFVFVVLNICLKRLLYAYWFCFVIVVDALYFCVFLLRWVYQPTNQPINQSAGQPINEWFNMRNNEWTNGLTNQAVNPTTVRWTPNGRSRGQGWPYIYIYVYGSITRDDHLPWCHQYRDHWWDSLLILGRGGQGLSWSEEWPGLISLRVDSYSKRTRS